MRKAQEIFDLSGKVALVTGASSGLGRRFGRVLAAHGAKVVLAARSVGKLEDLKAEIEADGGEAAVVALDVADKAQIPGAFDAAEKAFGVVTVLVNNAGIASQQPLLEISDEDWRKVRDVNYEGVWAMAQEGARRMADAGSGGSIINVASILGLRVAKTLSSYSVTKAAVIQLTKAMALELARYDIRVNAIAPGYVLTEMNREFFSSDEAQPWINAIPQRRIAEPEELDGLLLLLASDASSFMTGSVNVIDGGHSLSV
jgi:NAD(P)-dependent dehydrogenase (short-subunit alcohol dehydrogenase family)